MNSGPLTEHAESAVEDGADADDEESPPAQSAEPSLTTDTLFELLKNRRRRDAIGFLKAHDGQTTLSDLAEHIAAEENDVAVEGLSSKQRKRVYISLYQCHLPKMDRAGVVDFDKDRGTIGLRTGAAQLYPYLETVDTPATAGPAAGATPDTAAGVSGVGRLGAPSSALAGVGIAGLAGVAGVPGFDLLTPVLWTVVCAVSLLVAAALPVLTD